MRANQLFVAGHQKTLQQGLQNISAKTLFLPASNDLLLMPYMAEAAAEQLQSLNKDVTIEHINGPWGHLDGIYSIQQKASTLKTFLE